MADDDGVKVECSCEEGYAVGEDTRTCEGMKQILCHILEVKNFHQDFIKDFLLGSGRIEHMNHTASGVRGYAHPENALI